MYISRQKILPPTFSFTITRIIFYDFQLHKKNHFAKVFKNLTGYVSENYDLVSLTF